MNTTDSLWPRLAALPLLASIFHPDGPNDVAPSAFNQAEPPAGLPSSPLPPQPEATGFRRAAEAGAGSP